jgi:hypothetical protein
MIALFQIFFPGAWDQRQRKLVLHIDTLAASNGRVTQSLFERIPLRKRPQSPYSADSSPFNFYLFGKVNNALIDPDISDEIRLFDIVMQIVDGFSGGELQDTSQWY